MRRWAGAPIGRRESRRADGFRGLHEIAVADRPAGEQGLEPAQLRMLRLRTGWARAVGAPLSEVARLRACAGGRLVVDVPDALWKREMDRIKPRILERLAREVPCAPVTDLCFSVQRAWVRPSARGPASRLLQGAVDPASSGTESGAAAPTPLPERLSQALQQVEDASLRGQLGLVMGRYLARGPGLG